MSGPGADDSFADLLSPEPQRRLADAGLARALSFAFNGGGEQPELARALAQARCTGSLWDAECFAEGLFLQAFAERCLGMALGGRGASLTRGLSSYFVRVLGAPPAYPSGAEAVRYRQAIAQELAERPAAESAAQGLSDALHQFFELLESGGVGVRLDPLGRRLDILAALVNSVRRAAELGDQASSGLRRLGTLSTRISALPAFQRLETLLDHDAHLATVQVNVRLGRSRETRAIEVVRVVGNRANPYYSSVWRRIWGRLSCLVRGYRISREEILGRLVAEVFEELIPVVIGLLQLLGDLELYRASLALKKCAERRGLAMSLPRFSKQRRLVGLFNPLLLLDSRCPVETDLHLSSPAVQVVVTGPNSGGKTRLIQALGLTQALGQSGLWVPAQQAELPWHEGLFASLGGSAEVDQREGRLGMELLRIRSMFESLEVGALVLVDELCAGTNPAEAEPLFLMVLELWAQLGAHSFVTTHLLGFATRLRAEPPAFSLAFLRAGLDEGARPTFRFVAGVADTALAAQTAKRLGVTHSQLAELVQRSTGRALARELASGSPSTAQDPVEAGH